MGVDYIARKSAKKRKKKERQAVGKDGVAVRERRRKKIRRLCQGVCYKPPVLTDEDKQWSDKEEADAGGYDSDVAEAVARANSHRGASTSASGAGEATPKDPNQPGKAKQPPPNKKRKQADAAGSDAAPKDPRGGPEGGMSTSVRLLDPAVLAANARAAALKKLPPGSRADALEAYPPLLQACMLGSHHVEPTPVQEACWPAALEGRDVQGVAEPGSGKTLAYLLPGLVRLQAEGHTAATTPEGPAMLVLLPTRELALQVATECRNMRAMTGLRTVCVFGGAPREEQAALLASKRPHVLVATPGRLLDLVDGGELRLQGHVRYLVLDEADKMLSLGFKPQLDRLHALLLGQQQQQHPSDDKASSGGDAAGGGGSGDAAAADAPKASKKPKKAKSKQQQQQQGQSQGADGGGAGGEAPPAAASGSPSSQRPQVLLFSATMPAEVGAAASQWLVRPEVVRVRADVANAISRTVTQVVHVCAEHKKPDKLLKHLARVCDSVAPGTRNPPRVLVFANRVKAVRFLATSLAREGYKVAQLHGQRSQAERAQAVSDFKSGKAQVLVATDVAARGLHISALPYVVNYDFPSRLETYVHRVGRTGRLAAYGHAYSFFTRNMAPLAPPLLELLQAHGQSVDPNLVALAAAWRVAEQKLGSAGAAAAAAAARAGEGDGSSAGAGDEDEDGGEGEDGDDDEGDAAAAARADEGRLSLAEEVMGAAEDLMEGLGPRDARAIAALVRKKLTKQRQRQQDEDGAAGGEAAGAGDEDGSAEAARPGKRQRGQPEAAPAPAARGRGREGDVQLVPTTGEQRRAAQQGATAEGRQAAFLPSKTFAGAKPGYAFKKGPQGLGYYLDPVQPQQQARQQPASGGKAAGGKATAPAAAPGGAAGKPAKAREAGAAGAAAKPTAAAVKGGAVAKSSAAAAWGLPSRNKPIIPVRHSDFLSDSDAAQDSASGGGDWDSDGDGPDAPDAPRPKGTAAPKGGAAAHAGGKGGGESSGDEGGSDDSIGEGEGGRAAAKKKHKALPGRLRKKLAKARAQAGGRGKGSEGKAGRGPRSRNTSKAAA